MVKQKTAPHHHVRLREALDGYEDLEELALNVIWSWNHKADKIWRGLDSNLWDQTHNPWVLLQTVSVETLKKSLGDPAFRQSVDKLLETQDYLVNKDAWFQKEHPNCPLTCAAYFSMEYMLSEGLPIYSGGLGNVAGDQMKAASDLGVPIIGIGLLYQMGYFRQLIDKEGNQLALYPFNDPGQLPIVPLRKANGEWLRLEVPLPGWSLWIRVWQVEVGRIKLFLLDTNDPANYPAHRGITSDLYGGGPDLRIKQEIVLGIGGWRLMETLNLKPEVCHLNEGHAAFAILDRARGYMKETGLKFHEALEVIRAGVLFTTHTAVPAGFDRFSKELMQQFTSRYAQKELGISLDELMALGRENPQNQDEPFNMAYLALRGSGAVNGVSMLHGRVSRDLFASLFPRWSRDEVPVGYVTNGVHTPSWDSIQADDLWTKACGGNRWEGETESLDSAIRALSDQELWDMRNKARKDLIAHVRDRLSRQIAVRGGTPEEVDRIQHLFDPNTLTLGFARRFATYKRPAMLLQNPERLLNILCNPQRPIQLLIAGKAHPADKPGQELIKRWFQFIHQNSRAREHVMFLSDYDMLITERLVQGVDVWLNTPRRPWEACGTSGMKVLVNGGLNVSELDGWWAEAYAPDVGWALGDGKEHGDDPAYDAAEADVLYHLLEDQVAMAFYTRNGNGIPTEWVNKMRESMARLTPHYSANRAVRQYTEQYYIPAAIEYRKRAQDKGDEIIKWKQNLDAHWSSLRFADTRVETREGMHYFEVQVYLGDINPKWVAVQIYANGHEVVNMELVKSLPYDTYLYRGSVSAALPVTDFTPRVIPSFPGVAVPLEANHILWQR